MATKKKTGDTANLVDKKIVDKLSIDKYFQYHGERVHPYTQAFVASQFRGIIKTKEEWDDELAQYMEDAK